MPGRSNHPKRGAAGPRSTLSRAEVRRILRMVLDNANAIDKLREEQHIQFQRMARLQAELDSVKQALDRAGKLA